MVPNCSSLTTENSASLEAAREKRGRGEAADERIGQDIPNALSPSPSQVQTLLLRGLPCFGRCFYRLSLWRLPALAP